MEDIKGILLSFLMFWTFPLSAELIQSMHASTITVSDNSLIFSSSSSIILLSVNIVYPYEDMKLPSLSKTFVFGNIQPSTASLRINGEKINVYKNGGFIAYLPVGVGQFRFEAEVSNSISTATYVRKVYVTEKNKVEVSTNTSFLEIIYPNENLELMTGDYLNIVARATPNSSVVYELKNIDEGKMQEYPFGSGYYYGVYKMGENDSPEEISLVLKLKKGLFYHDIRAISKSKIKVRRNSFLLTTSTSNVILKNDVMGGYTLFLSSGIKLVGTGKVGTMYRVKVGDMTLWVSENQVNYLTDNVKEPKTETGSLYLKKIDHNKLKAQLAIYEKVPYVVYEKENSLILTLYYTNVHTNWIVYDSSDTFIKNVNFRQIKDNVVEFVFNFNEKSKLWGYDVDYENNFLNINLKLKPEIKTKPQKPLEGLKIIIDPGHSPKRTPPFDGAIGPMGSFEYEVNLKISEKLKDKLLNSGATVYLTRYGEENVPLALRHVIARQLDGDMFISIHNNAIPDGEDPFIKPRGFQIYFYHNHSMPLAYHVHRAFLKNIPLPDEGLRYGDYYVIRTNTWMPAILIENAYMILPEQEEMLNDIRWQDKFAETIREGILNFLKEDK